MTTIQDKISSLLSQFHSSKSAEEKYLKIIELGSKLPPVSPSLKLDTNLVPGCQSKLYIDVKITPENTLSIQIDSDALISKGLGALLYLVYNGSQPEAIFKNPPTYLEELGLFQNLSMNRSQGLLSLIDTLKKKILLFLAQSS